jgi:hypothetical protein
MAASPFANKNLPAENPEPTLEQISDQFAALALKAALTPEPDGLNLLDELARVIPKTTRQT